MEKDLDLLIAYLEARIELSNYDDVEYETAHNIIDWIKDFFEKV